MAKLGKVKFDATGYVWKERTTSSSDIELYLYYDTDCDIFYFSPAEVNVLLNTEDHIGYYRHTFGGCRTKSDAVSLLSSLISKNIKETKMLKIKLTLNRVTFSTITKKSEDNFSNDEYSVNNNVGKHLLPLIEPTTEHKLGIVVERFMKVESNGKTFYVRCRKDWKWHRTNLTDYMKDEEFIEWSEQKELFLLGAQHQLDLLSKKILDFFNTEDMDSLMYKLEASGNMLLLPSNS